MSTRPNKRDRVLALLGQDKPTYTPAAFFLHFDPEHHKGQAAVRKHLEFFRATDMDLLKIQYEHRFPTLPQIREPKDWGSIPQYGAEFFRDPLDVVRGLVEEARKEALVVVTLYSPFMFAGHLASPDLLVRHLDQDPEPVSEGLSIVTQSVLNFVRVCIRAGVDGFYASTQGGEAGRFGTPGIFERYIKPWDLAVWDVIRECPFNILHVCDYHLKYETLKPFRDYPGQVVSAGLELEGGPVRAREVSDLFGRPYLGGMDRLGVIATGSVDQVRAAANAVLRDAPPRFLLGADCTVPSTTPWANLRAAVDTAHTASRG